MGGPDRFAQRLGLLVRLGRPQFLVYSAVLVSLGGALSLTLGRPLVLGPLLQTLLLVWTNHVMTHYVNEFFDLEVDRANQSPTGWTGGSRVLAEGLLSPEVAIGAAVTLMSPAWPRRCACRARRVWWPGWAWRRLGYTAPPFRSTTGVKS
jgi:1,4-dihydroxy-2-naphthoate octaprenyltransferase